MEEVFKWLLTVGSASVAAYVGSWLALGKAKKEKVWLQKQEAYLNIIEALHNTIIWADEEYAVNFPYPLPTVSKEKLHELRSNQDRAMEVLRKHVHLGELVVSKSASDKLETMLSEYYGEEFRFYDDPSLHDNQSDEASKHYQKLRELAEQHIKEIKDIAKSDLGL